jgi:hypothetical protein
MQCYCGGLLSSLLLRETWLQGSGRGGGKSQRWVGGLVDSIASGRDFCVGLWMFVVGRVHRGRFPPPLSFRYLPLDFLRLGRDGRRCLCC